MDSYHCKEDGSLEITCSDSQQQHVNEERIPEVHDHPDGRKRYYVQQFNNSSLSKEWRKKLGVDLATMYLLKPHSRHSMYPIIIPSSKLLLTASSVDYILTKFPKGYKLFSHRKGVNHEVDRTDAYLYSRCFPVFSFTHPLLTLSLPTGDNHKFRSPAEFIPHAAWLMAGQPANCCKCRYCTPGRGRFSQRRLNNELSDGYKVAVDKEKRREYLAAKNGQPYTRRDEPLKEVFLNLKTVSGPGEVHRSSRSRHPVSSHR
jgi:Transcription-silencing protein, cryptic loci regulator Clr2